MNHHFFDFQVYRFDQSPSQPENDTFPTPFTVLVVSSEYNNVACRNKLQDILKAVKVDESDYTTIDTLEQEGLGEFIRAHEIQYVLDFSGKEASTLYHWQRFEDIPLLSSASLSTLIDEEKAGGKEHRMSLWKALKSQILNG